MQKMNKKGNINPLFPIPAVVINIGRSFTKSELQLLLSNVPMGKNEGETNHRSKDFYLFDTFAEELKDIKKFCEHQLKQYLEEIEGVDTNLVNLRETWQEMRPTHPDVMTEHWDDEEQLEMFRKEEENYYMGESGC